MNKIVIVSGLILLVALVTISVRAESPKLREGIIQKLDEIKLAIQGSSGSNYNIYPNITANVSVVNEVPVPEVNLNSTCTPEISCPEVTCPNISSGGGIVFSLKCAWKTNNNELGSCVPPSCPEGYTDLGTGNVPTAITTAGASFLAGYSERWCAKLDG